jgi:anti-anti-sigma factor
MTGLEVSTRWDDDACIVTLQGEARLETVQRLDEAASEVLDRGAQHVLLDMTQLAFMDSASTGALLRLRSQMGERGGSLVLFGLQRVIRRLLEHSGLQDRFTCAADETEARAKLEVS